MRTYARFANDFFKKQETEKLTWNDSVSRHVQQKLVGTSYDSNVSNKINKTLIV